MVTKIDVRELMKRVTGAERPRAVPPPLEPIPPLEPVDHLIHGDDLAWLNRNWLVDFTPIVPPRPRALGGFRDRLKWWAIETVSRAFSRYFENERELFAHLARLQNETARRCDRLIEEIRVLDGALRRLARTVGETSTVLQSESIRLAERDDALHGALEERIAALEQQLIRGVDAPE